MLFDLFSPLDRFEHLLFYGYEVKKESVKLADCIYPLVVNFKEREDCPMLNQMYLFDVVKELNQIGLQKIILIQ